MPELLAAVAALVASYVLGSIPFGLLLARFIGGVDPRRDGSGNVGATNVARLIGKRWFPVVFFLDAAKGAAAVHLVTPLAGPDVHWLPLARTACGGAAVAGHVFSVFLRFRGGKGVTTTAGVLAALAPLPLLGAVVVFVVTLTLSGFISLASVLAAIAVPLLAWWWTAPSELLWFSGTIAALILIRHYTNLYRILRGLEPRLRAHRTPRSRGAARTDPPDAPGRGDHE